MQIVVDFDEMVISVGGEIMPLGDVAVCGSRMGWRAIELLIRDAEQVARDIGCASTLPKYYKLTEREGLSLPTPKLESVAEREYIKAFEAHTRTLPKRDSTLATYERLQDAGSAAYERLQYALRWYPNLREWDLVAIRSLARKMAGQYLYRQRNKQAKRDELLNAKREELTRGHVRAVAECEGREIDAFSF